MRILYSLRCGKTLADSFSDTYEILDGSLPKDAHFYIKGWVGKRTLSIYPLSDATSMQWLDRLLPINWISVSNTMNRSSMDTKWYCQWYSMMRWQLNSDSSNLCMQWQRSVQWFPLPFSRLFTSHSHRDLPSQLLNPNHSLAVSYTPCLFQLLHDLCIIRSNQ